MPATVSHALSMTTPDDPAYENQPKHWNSAHNVTFNILATEISQLFSNKNGVSFGLDGTNITGSISPGVPSPVNFSAGTTSSDLGSVVFANGNGVSFGLNGATITGSVATTYRASNDAIGLNSALTAGPVAVTANSSGLSLNFGSVAGTSTGFTGGASISGSMTHNTAGLAVSLAHPAWITTAMQSNAATISNIRVSAGTTSNLLSAITFADSNGLAFGINASTITGSYSQSSHSHETEFKAITLGGNSAGTSTFNASNNASIFLNGGNNITLSGNGSTITISAAAQTNQSAIKAFGVSNTGQTAGNTGVSTGVDWVLAGSNSITLSQSTAVGGPNTIWVQHPAWITTARASNDAIGLNTAKTNVTWTVNSSGLSFDASGYAGTGFTSTTTAGTEIKGTHNTAGLSLGVPVFITTQTNQQMTMFATGNTTQSSTGTSNASSLIFRGEGVASIGISNGSVVVSVPSGGGGGAAVSISGNSTSGGAGYSNISSGTAIFAGGPNITLSQDGSRISISANNPGAAAENNNINLLGANTAGNTTASGSTIGLSGLNLTLSGTNASQVVISAPATSSLSATGFLSISTNGSTISVGAGPLSFFAASNTTQSSSGTIDGRSISFQGRGLVSMGVSNGSIVVSGGDNGGVYAGVSTMGNTAGSTGTVSTGNVVFVGSRGVTLSQSTGAAGSAATITILGEAEGSIYRNYGQISAAATAQGNSLVSIQPFILQHDLVFSNVMLPMSINVATAANNSSGYLDVSVSGVLYSRNVSTLSSVTSVGQTLTQTWSSNATGTVTGVIGVSATCNATTLSEGEYFWAFHVSTNNTATGGANTTALANTFSNILAYSIGSAANLIKKWGAQTNNSQGLYPGLGMISTGATRASIAFSDYTMTGTRAFLAPVAFEMRNDTWQV